MGGDAGQRKVPGGIQQSALLRAGLRRREGAFLPSVTQATHLSRPANRVGIPTCRYRERCRVLVGLNPRTRALVYRESAEIQGLVADDAILRSCVL